MFCLTVMYPNTAGSAFNWEYYLTAHLELAHGILVPFGLLQIQIDRGASGFPPDSAPPFYAIARLSFPSLDALEKAMAATAEALIADQKKYYSGESVVQIGEQVRA